MGSWAHAAARKHPATSRRDRRRPRRPDGRRDRTRGRDRGACLRGQGFGGPQIPDRRQGRTEPDPLRSAPGLRCALPRACGRGRCLAGWVRWRRAARLGTRFRHRHVCRQFRPRVPDRPQGGAAAARMGAPPARCRRAVACPASLAGLGRPRCAAFFHAARRNPVPRRRRGAGAGRRQLAATRLRWRVGGAAGGPRHRHRATATRELRVRYRLERLPRHAPRGRAAEDRWSRTGAMRLATIMRCRASAC